jgi:hypothetical protein
MTSRRMAGLTLVGIFCGGLVAQPNRMKPGLWEATSLINMGDATSMIPEDRLAKMTPEQRAQIQAMVKQSVASPMATKLCYTKEQIEKGLNYNLERAGTCTSKTISSTGARQVSEISCDNGRTKTTGTVTMESTDPEHYTGLVQMKTTMNGQNRDMTVKLTGKWLASDCGDVKPRDYSK